MPITLITGSLHSFNQRVSIEMVMTITVVVGTLVIEDDKVNFVKGA